MSTRNLPSMPEITDAFLNELVGDIINDVEHETEYTSITTNDERKHEFEKQQQIPTYPQRTTNNFTLQNTKTNIISTTHSNEDKIQSKTMQKWLNNDQLMVHPVWIGNLPSNISTSELRHFVESNIGKVTVSIHINNNINNCAQHKTYAFVNLPTAEKQMLVITLLDNAIWKNCSLMVRANKPVKFQQSSFFSSGNSKISQQYFQQFQDIIVPAIIKNDINIQSVANILQIYGLKITDLPNRVFGKQCTLTPNCHRKYCSFYHCDKQKELGRIISILAMENNGQINERNNEIKMNINNKINLNGIKSRHTLLVKGLTQNKREKIAEMFDVFGDVDTVMVNGNNMCYVRMKYTQDAQKIVRLFSNNRNGVYIDFAAYPAPYQHLKLQKESVSEPLGQETYNRNGQWSNGYLQIGYGNGQKRIYQKQQQISGYYNGLHMHGNRLGLNLRNAYSHSDVQNYNNNNNNNGYVYGYNNNIVKNDNPANKSQ